MSTPTLRRSIIELIAIAWSGDTAQAFDALHPEDRRDMIAAAEDVVLTLRASGREILPVGSEWEVGQSSLIPGAAILMLDGLTPEQGRVAAMTMTERMVCSGVAGPAPASGTGHETPPATEASSEA